MQASILNVYESVDDEGFTEVTRSRQQGALARWLRADDLYHDEYEEVFETPEAKQQVRRVFSRLRSSPIKFFAFHLCL